MAHLCSSLGKNLIENTYGIPCGTPDAEVSWCSDCRVRNLFTLEPVCQVFARVARIDRTCRGPRIIHGGRVPFL